VYFDLIRERSHLLFEMMAAGNLERHCRHLPRLGRDLERFFESTDMQDEDPGGTQLDGPTDRHRPYETPIEIMASVQLDSRQ
jgi:hypothetical protein